MSSSATCAAASSAARWAAAISASEGAPDAVPARLPTAKVAAAARWVIKDLHWLALVAGVVVALKMYWVALVVRPRLLNRI